MAIKANKDSVSIEVRLDYNEKQAQRIAQSIDGFQRKQQQQAERHQDKLRQSQETHQQRLKQMEERANKQAEIRAKQHQARLLKGTKTWSAKMLDSINSIKASVIAMGTAFISAQVIGGIKQLATESLSLASDINTLAKATNFSVESLSKLRGIATVTGVEARTLESAINAVAAKLQDARDGSQQVQEQFERLGINYNQDNIERVVQLLFEAARNADDLGKVSDITGARAATAFAKMATYATSWESAMAAARDMFGQLNTDGAQALNALSDKIAGIRLQVSYSITNALANAVPELEKIVEELAKALREVDWDSLVKGAIDLSKALGDVGNIIANIAPWTSMAQLIAVMDGGILSLTDKFVNLNKKSAQASLAFETSSSALSKFYGWIERASWSMSLLFARIGNAINSFFSSIKALSMIRSAFDVISTAIGGVWKWLTKLRVLGAFFKKLPVIGWIISITSALWDFGKAMNAGIGLLGTLKIVLTNFIDDLFFGLIGWRKENEDLIKTNEDLMESESKKTEHLEEQAERQAEAYRKFAEKASEEMRKLIESNALNAESSLLSILPEETILRMTKMFREEQNEIIALAEQVANSNIEDKRKVEILAELNTQYQEATESLKQFRDAYSKKLESNAPALPSPEVPLVSMQDDTVANETLTNLDKLILKTSQDFDKYEESVMTSKAAMAYFTAQGTYTKEELAKIASMLGVTVKNSYEALKSAALDYYNSVKQNISALISAEQDAVDRQNEKIRRDNEAAKLELDRLRALGMANTRYYRDKEKAANKEEVTSTKRMRRLKRLQQLMSVSEAVINGAVAITNIQKAWASNPIMVAILSALTTASVATQIATIKAQKFATGGLIQGNPYQDSTQVLAQGGEYIVNQTATERNRGLLESINNGASYGGGNPITINIQGNVLGEDRWVRDNLIPEIKRAVREGHTLAYA